MLEELGQKAQVVIVGAGPSGLMAANLLGLYGIQTVLLERNATLSSQPKAVVIDDEGLRICQAIGVHEEMLAHVCFDLQVEYRSGKRLFAHITPKNRPNGYPLISTFHQPMLETILLHSLKRFSCVQIYFGHTLETFTQTPEEVTLQVRTPKGMMHSLSCTYLLGCDGGKSGIRHALSLLMRPISPLPFTRGRAADAIQRWLVADVQESAGESVQQSIIFFCNPSRPAVTVPTPGQTRRWEFMLFPGENEETLLRPEMLQTLITQTHFVSGVTRECETAPVATVQVIRQAIYTFHALRASSFSQGRVFLLGDAAHLMPPFGGQGMNSGLRDAYNLCWKLACVLQGKASEELLQSYERERALHTSRMIRFSALLGQVIMPTWQPVAFARDLLFRGIDLIPPMKRHLNEMRVKPAASYQVGYAPLLAMLIRHRSFDQSLTKGSRRDTFALSWTQFGKDGQGPQTGRFPRHEDGRLPTGERRSKLPLRGFFSDLGSRASRAFSVSPGTWKMCPGESMGEFASLANGGMRLAHSLPDTKIFRLMMWVRAVAQRHTLIGILLPQVRVIVGEKQVVLLDDILEDTFSLLRLYERQSEIWGEIIFFTWDDTRTLLNQAVSKQNRRQKRTRWETGGQETVEPSALQEYISRHFRVVEGERELSRIVRQAQGDWLLLRPDHFILDILL